MKLKIPCRYSFSSLEVLVNGETLELKGIEYQALIPLLFESIKEQQNLIENLRERIQHLETHQLKMSDHQTQ